MTKSALTLSYVLAVITASAQLTYVEVADAPFLAVQESTVTKFDADGDGDTDVVITGTDDFNVGRCDLFLNNGNLDFTLDETTPFAPVQYGAVAAGDVDGDGFMDLFVSGFYQLERISELYLNDGSGGFTLSDQNTFEPAMNAHAVFFDADGDDDLDLIYSGLSTAGTKVTLLYLNDGNGIFSEDMGVSFPGLNTGDLNVADINNDGHTDILMLGLNDSGERVVKLYLNDSGVFTELPTEFPAMSACSIEFFHANADEYIDVMLSGSPFGPNFTDLFINNGDETFSLLPENDFNEMYNCHSAVADIDDDGDLDIMICGVIEPNQECYLYINDGSGVYTEDAGSLYLGSPSQNGELTFEDFDGDGTPEFLITGFYQNEGRIAKLYTLDEAMSVLERHDESYRLYPNPSSGMIYVDTPHIVQSVKVIDATGRTVLTNAFENGAVNGGALPVGMYTLLIEGDAGRAVRRVSIQR